MNESFSRKGTFSLVEVTESSTISDSELFYSIVNLIESIHE